MNSLQSESPDTNPIVDGEITAIRPASPPGRRVSSLPAFIVEIDGGVWAELDAETIVRHGLKKGRCLNSKERSDVLRADNLLRARRWAAARCAAKPRTRRELRQSLLRKKFSASIVDEALDALEMAGTIDDVAVASRHLRKRHREGGFGRLRLMKELEELGIDRGVAGVELGKSLENIDPLETCLELVRKRAPRYEPLDDSRNRNRFVQFLLRRGFEMEVIHRALGRIQRSEDSDSI